MSKPHEAEKLRNRVRKNEIKETKNKRITLGNLHEYIKLKPRDKKVLVALYYHQVLTTHQIAEAFFAFDKNGNINKYAEVSARRRLLMYKKAKLVKAYVFDAPTDRGTVPQHFVLTGLGARVVAGALNLDIKEMGWKHEHSVITEKQIPYLAHDIGVNDFYLYLLRSARNYGHEVHDFITDRHIRHEVPRKGRGKYIIQPDAYGQYWLDPQTYIHFLLEWDNGTMTVNQFVKKYEGYVALFASKQLETSFGDVPPYILVVAPDDDRAIRLRNAMYLNRNMPMTWLFTSKERVEEQFLGRIWLGAEEKPVSLL